MAKKQTKNPLEEKALTLRDQAKAMPPVKSDEEYESAGGNTAAKKAADQMVLGNLLAQQNVDERLKPWLESGSWALGELKDLMTNPLDEMLMDPGYQFRLREGVNAINKAAAAQGRLKSGATLKKLLEYGQGVGSQEYQNIYNRYANLAGLATPTANNAASSAANLISGTGQAQAAGTVGGQNQINAAISQILQLLQSRDVLDRVYGMPRY